MQSRFDDERDTMYARIKSAYHTGFAAVQNISFLIHFGDARACIAAETNQHTAHAVFQDPYSPSKNPELWSLDYFKMLAPCIYNDAVLTTYSAAPQVRRALLEAGFYLARGPAVGRKKEGTLASKKQFSENGLTQDQIDAVLSDIKSTVYRDEHLDALREVILAQRIEQMRKLRATGCL